MVSTFTINRHIELPARGDDPGTWDVPANGDFTIIDSCFGNSTSVTLTSANVTLSNTQLQAFRFALSGTLSANVNVVIPSGVGGLYVFDNQTNSSSFTVSVINSGGTGVVLPQGVRSLIAADGTNARYATDGVIPPGSIMAYGGSAVPPGWLLCDGTVYNTSSFPILSAAIGTAFGGGGGTFAVPDYRGRALTGADSFGGAFANRITNATVNSPLRGGNGGSQQVTLTLAQSPSHNHGGLTGLTSNQHEHQYTSPTSANTNVQAGTSYSVVGGFFTATSAADFPDHDHSIATAGADGAHTNLQPTLLCLVIIKT